MELESWRAGGLERRSLRRMVVELLVKRDAYIAKK
jgi:hypothetical protein